MYTHNANSTRDSNDADHGRSTFHIHSCHVRFQEEVRDDGPHSKDKTREVKNEEMKFCKHFEVEGRFEAIYHFAVPFLKNEERIKKRLT